MHTVQLVHYKEFPGSVASEVEWEESRSIL